MNTQKANDELKKIIDLFSKEELPCLIKKAYLENVGKPCESWSLGNQLLTILSGTSDARGFNQWIKVGRHVKKGSKAIYILAPNTRKIKDEETEEEKTIVTGFRGMPVFRFEDTDGAALKEYEPKTPLPLKEVAENWGIKITYSKTRRGEFGYFSPKEDRINLCVEDPDVFFHELGHLAHSKFETLKGGQDPEQEAIAELTAATLASMYGYDVKSEAYQYIKSYSQSKTPEQVGRFCMKVAGKVQKVLKLILEEKEKLEVIAK
jgi:antirestriction protein ArdC